jgi:hypothetical protein
LPLLGTACLVGAVLVGRSRRRTLVAAALALAGSMVVLGGVLNAFRVVYLDAVPPDRLPADAAAAVYDTFSAFIRVNLRAVLALALATAFVAWVAGPGRSAVAVRHGTGGVVGMIRAGALRAGLDTGPLGSLLNTYRNVIRGGVLAGALVLYVMRDHPTGGFVLVLVIAVGVLLLVLELLARPVTDTPRDVATSKSPQG